MGDSLKIIDTVYVGVYDSSMVVTGKHQQVIIIQDNQPLKGKTFLEENPLITILFIPVLVAIAGTYFTFLLNRKKYKGEVDKLKVETERIKNSYEQVVLDTIQQVNSGLLDQKIKGLQELVALHENFTDYQQVYDNEGIPLDEYEDYLIKMLEGFNQEKFDEFTNFRIKYGYLYNSTAHENLNTLVDELYILKESSISASLNSNPMSSYAFYERVPPILNQFTECLNAIRSELHLDNDFTSKYVKNKITLKEEPKV